MLGAFFTITEVGFKQSFDCRTDQFLNSRLLLEFPDFAKFQNSRLFPDFQVFPINRHAVLSC